MLKIVRKQTLKINFLNLKSLLKKNPIGVGFPI